MKLKLIFDIKENSLLIFYNTEKIFEVIRNNLQVSHRTLDLIINRINFSYKDEFEWKIKFKPKFQYSSESYKSTDKLFIHYSDVQIYIFKLYNFILNNNNEFYIENDTFELISELSLFLILTPTFEIEKMMNDELFLKAKKLILENQSNNRKLLKLISEFNEDDLKAKERLKETVSSLEKILS